MTPRGTTEDSDTLRVHLGCGSRYFDGWINIDRAPYERLDYTTDIRHLTMFEDESVDVVYTSHTFHYFSWDEAPGVLLEWKRIIRPTGRLFISVPNVEALLSVYEKTREVHLIRGPLLGTMPDGLGGSIHTQMIYNHSTLRSLMTMCGFNNVDTFSPDDIIGNNDDYSRSYYPHQGSSGIHLSVNLVGWKE